jgi:predicted Zn finger-like uncharacterized protein
MKVQCGQCPAKYAVSDERIQDKKVRIHCKKCGASIVVDGKVDPPLVTSTPARKSQRPATAPSDSEPPPEREPESRPSPRPVAHTIMGGLEAPAAERLLARSSPPPRPMRSPASPPARYDEELPRTGMPANHRGLTDPPPGADQSRWRVALTKQDLRWMTTDEIVEAYHAGAVKLETFVFRTGMPTWVTLLEVPEIAEALAEAGPGPAGAPISSLPPSRSPSSQPPPRRLPVRSASENAALADLAELEASDPLPFALVAHRANGGSPPPAEPVREEPSPPPPPARPNADPRPHFDARPSFDAATNRAAPAAERAPRAAAAVAAPLSADDHPAPPPFAAAREASGSSRWIWVAVVLLLLGAVAALIGPRFGLKLL